MAAEKIVDLNSSLENEPGNKPPRNRPGVLAFLFAGLGLFLLNGAADSLALDKTGLLAWILVIAGAALFILAVLWGTGRV